MGESYFIGITLLELRSADKFKEPDNRLSVSGAKDLTAVYCAALHSVCVQSKLLTVEDSS